MIKPLLSKPILNKIIYLLSSVSLLLLVFLFSDPNQVSLAFLLVPFLLIGIAVYSFTGIIVAIRVKPSGLLGYLIPLSSAFMVVTLFLLASLGQLTLRDGLLVIGFTIVFLLYVGRADFLK